MSSHSCGVMTNHTVSATNATSAPTLRMFLPGSISGVDLMRADSLRLATIEPVNVTAPMKTPMNDLGGVDAEQALAVQQGGFGAGEVAFDVQVAVPADQHRGQADERVQQRDQLGHAGHLDDAGTPQADRGADRHRADQQADTQRFDVAGQRQRDGGDQRDRHAGDAEGVAGPRRFVLGQPGQGQDEQQGRDDVGRGGSGL